MFSKKIASALFLATLFSGMIAVCGMGRPKGRRNSAVTANFYAKATVAGSGTATGTIGAVSGSATATVTAGTATGGSATATDNGGGTWSLTATPSSGYTFSGWSCDALQTPASTSASSTTITPTASTTCTPAFTAMLRRHGVALVVSHVSVPRWRFVTFTHLTTDVCAQLRLLKVRTSV